MTAPEYEFEYEARWEFHDGGWFPDRRSGFPSASSALQWVENGAAPTRNVTIWRRRIGIWERITWTNDQG